MSLPVSEAWFVFLWSSSVKGLSAHPSYSHPTLITIDRYIQIFYQMLSVWPWLARWTLSLNPFTDEYQRNTNKASLTGKFAQFFNSLRLTVKMFQRSCHVHPHLDILFGKLKAQIVLDLKSNVCTICLTGLGFDARHVFFFNTFSGDLYIDVLIKGSFTFI